MEPFEYVQSDLRFLIPIHQGDRALIFGGTKALGEAIQSEKVELTTAEQVDSIPAESADHVLIPELTKELLNGFPDQYSRILKPNGWIFVGVHNAESLERLAFWKLKRKAKFRLSIRQCKKMFHKNGIEVVGFYGVNKNLQHPQFLIALEHKEQTAFFFEHMYYPYSRRGAVMQTIAQWMVALGMHRCLFNDIAIVARRASIKHDLHSVGKSNQHLVQHS